MAGMLYDTNDNGAERREARIAFPTTPTRSGFDNIYEYKI